MVNIATNGEVTNVVETLGARRIAASSSEQTNL